MGALPHHLRKQCPIYTYSMNRGPANFGEISYIVLPLVRGEEVLRSATLTFKVKELKLRKHEIGEDKPSVRVEKQYIDVANVPHKNRSGWSLSLFELQTEWIRERVEVRCSVSSDQIFEYHYDALPSFTVTVEITGLEKLYYGQKEQPLIFYLLGGSVLFSSGDSHKYMYEILEEPPRVESFDVHYTYGENMVDLECKFSELADRIIDYISAQKEYTGRIVHVPILDVVQEMSKIDAFHIFYIVKARTQENPLTVTFGHDGELHFSKKS